MGWKPRGYDSDEVTLLTTQSFEWYDKNRKARFHHKSTCIWSDFYSLRDLVSIESGFLQFVLDNHLTNLWNENWFVIDEVETDSETVNYWLAKSSIQTDIEKFILENVLIPTNTEWY